ncbi:FecR family protein [Pedobacter nototheniae]|uniref:FecR family protein n=1 Tax=Pedobacter nototheniae TaxID=2488994 RepID=UPI001038AD79|nr:FecR family protein [Pedobacter nototheniae]
MNEQQQLEKLYKLYLSNQCSEEELERFFELLEHQDDDNEILELMAATWDNTHTLPDIDLIPDFLPVEAKQIKLQTAPLIGINLRRFIGSAAAILVVAIGIYFFRSNLSSFINPVHQQEIWSKAGERKKIQLADGSKIWLSPNSKLNYPDQFNDKQRIVSLDGEAFFEVAHDEKHPFIIKTGKVNTAVLGTSFNISAYSKENTVNVTLVSGKVAVALATKNKTYTEIILPNQQVIVDRNNEKLSKINYPDAASFLNKRLGIYEYKGIALKQVLQDIEMQYNLHINLNNNLLEKTFYGNLNMNDSITQTLNKLCTVMEITWEKKGEQYEIIK